MTPLRFTRVITVFLVILATAIQAEAPKKPPADLTVGSDFLSAEALKKNRNAALAGDVKAAIALSNYYMYFANDIVESDFWIKLAAEEGDCGAIKDYIERLKHHTYLNSQARIDVWTEKDRAICANPAKTDKTVPL